MEAEAGLAAVLEAAAEVALEAADLAMVAEEVLVEDAAEAERVALALFCRLDGVLHGMCPHSTSLSRSLCFLCLIQTPL